MKSVIHIVRLLAFSWFALSQLGSIGAVQVETSEQGKAGAKSEQSSDQITLLVMDPLSSQLACDCVQGYAQRDYEKFGLHLSKKTGRPVHVVFCEKLTDGLKETQGQADIVIGKHSVVLAGAKAGNLELEPVFQLTDKQDSTEQTGLLVVRANNAAKTVADLQGYRVLYGPADCDEKHAAPMALLRKHGIETTEPPAADICSACSVAAKELMNLSDSDKAVAVISSYAQPLLEGCGNIRKGDLRVVGESAAVPFVSVFFAKSLLQQNPILAREAFTDVEIDAELMTALETGSGFIPWAAKQNTNDKAGGTESEPIEHRNTQAVSSSKKKP